MRIKPVQHIISLLVFSAFVNLWFPASLTHQLHEHDHTSHSFSDDYGIYIDSEHHHCPKWNVIVLPTPSVALVIGKSFLRYLEIPSRNIEQSEIRLVSDNQYNRGPPGELIFKTI